MRSSFYVGSCCLVGQGKVVLLIIISSAMYNKSPISITATAFPVMDIEKLPCSDVMRATCRPYKGRHRMHMHKAICSCAGCWGCLCCLLPGR